MSVHKLTGHQLPGEPNGDIVVALEDLLERAKRGEITCLAWAGHTPNDTSFNAWEGSGGTLFKLAADIMLLHSRYGLFMQDDGE